MADKAAHPQPDLRALVVENFRQPAAQSRSHRARAFFLASWLLVPGLGCCATAFARHRRPAWFAFARSRTHPQAGATAMADAFARNGASAVGP